MIARTSRKIAWSVLVIILSLPALVLAGGWSVLTLDEWPAQVTADEPLTVGFVVRQHGQHPISGLDASVTAVHADTGEKVNMPAQEQGEPGHYAATLTLPQAGTWHWYIDAFGTHPLPDLTVQAAVSANEVGGNGAAVNGSFVSRPVSLPWLAGIVGLLSLAVVLFFWQRRSGTTLIWPRWVAPLVLVALAAAASTAFLARPTPPAPVEASAAAADTLTPVQSGEILFVAKGCIRCHQHGGVTVIPAGNSIQFGPNLTHYAGDATYLQSWLKDPSALKPATQMPNLNLSKVEIDTLIAFLTAEKP